MTNDMPDSPSSTPAPTRRVPYVIGAVLIGAVIGFAGVYGVGGLKRNVSGDSSCASAVNLSKKIAPLAHGEVAALTMATAPLRLPDLAFDDASGKPRNFLKAAKLSRLGYFSDEKAKVFQDLKAIGRALGMPTSVLIDAQGCEIATIAGPAEWDSEDAVKLITAASAPSGS